MDKLEKFFDENMESFEEEPLKDHFSRFEARLDHFHSGKKRTLKGWQFLKIASVLIIVLLSADLAIHLLPAKTLKNKLLYENTELNETANFYNTRINSGMSQLDQLAEQGIGSKQELLQVKKEMDELDKLYQDLQNEYSKNPNDERVINAMIEYYQTKLNIINRIKSDLENVKILKNKNHENKKL